MAEEQGSDSRVPVDRGWAWVVLFAAALMTVFIYGTYKSFGILFVEFLIEFDASQSVTAMIAGLVSLCNTITPPVASALANRYTNRAVVIVGGLFCAAGSIATCYLKNVQHVIFVYGILTGVGYGLVYAPGIVMVGQYFNKRRALANGLAVAGSSIGQFAIPPVMRYLIDKYTFRGALLILGGLMLHICVSGALFTPLSFYTRFSRKRAFEMTQVDTSVKPKPPAHDEQEVDIASDKLLPNQGDRKSEDVTLHQADIDDGKQNGGKQYDINGADAVEKRKSNLLPPPDRVVLVKKEAPRKPKMCDFTVFSNMQFLLFFFAVFFANIGYINMMVILAPHGKDLNISKANVAWLLSTIGFGDLVGRIGCGILADLPWVKKRVHSYHFVLVTFAVNGVASLTCTISPAYSSLIVYCALLGVFGGCYVAMMAVVLTDFVGIGRLPTAFGFLLMVIGMGNTAGPPLMGWIRDVTGSYMLAFRIGGICSCIGAFLLLFEPCARRFDERRERRRAEEARLDEAQSEKLMHKV